MLLIIHPLTVSALEDGLSLLAATQSHEYYQFRSIVTLPDIVKLPFLSSCPLKKYFYSLISPIFILSLVILILELTLK